MLSKKVLCTEYCHVRLCETSQVGAFNVVGLYEDVMCIEFEL